ncbi:IclR family transcriptional regulator domain-containing protein [Sphingomonas sp. SRS2]|uniref:IclR family transcriptional regulator domain-containing protein n=1 Tax=Sphingomonas sp. SRS2 TaxID=133190 RepID=UPI0006184CB0|nr:IclR family transcriptional regulator C-terminal domain-containing protein [Sphingomonas sp. SRS2]KKC24140.1 IclR family transcriptional regulator [Sphingomonas sp. SRS2]
MDEGEHSPDGPGNPSFMLSLARGLAVLKAFEGQDWLSIADAARLTGLARASVGRCLYTLKYLGHVREQGGRYALAPGLLPLASNYLTSTPLATAGQSVVNGLRDRLGETVSLGVLDPARPARIIYIARSEKSAVIAGPLMVGSTLPSHCTSMGRVIVAAMEDAACDDWFATVPLPARTSRTITDPAILRRVLGEVRRQGWALVEEELEAGLRSLAVPIRGRDGATVAALNVATFSHAHERSTLLDTFLPELRAAAGQLERMV